MLKKVLVLAATTLVVLGALAVMPEAAAHGGAKEDPKVRGYTFVLRTDPSPAVAGESATLKLGVLCTENGKHVAGDLAVAILRGGATVFETETSLKTNQEAYDLKRTLEAGGYTVEATFTPADASACTANDGSVLDGDARTAKMTFTVEEKSLLPAPGVLALAGGIAAVAVLSRRRNGAS